MPLKGAKISICTHTRGGSTMIKTPWHAKIDAQELFYFMTLPVGGTLIDLALSMKARLEFTHMPMELWYLTTTMNALPITMRNPSCGGVVPLVTTWIYRCYCCAEKWSWKTTKWEFSAHVSSCSLEERTAVESQINGLYLTLWCRHHKTVLGSKSCTSVTRMLYGDTDLCLPTLVLYKISTKANIQIVNRGEGSWTSNLHAGTSLPSAFSC